MSELHVSDRDEDRQMASEAGRVLEDILIEIGNPRAAMYLEDGYLCGELVLAALRRAGVLQISIDMQTFRTALMQIKEDASQDEK